MQENNIPNDVENNDEKIKKEEENRFKKFDFLIKTFIVLYVFSLAAALNYTSKLDLSKKQFAAEKTVTLKEALAANSGKSAAPAIGVIKIYGAISQSMKEYSWDNTGSNQVASKIRKMAAKKNIKAIVLDINSPGGTVGAVQEIYSAVLRAKNEYKKPVFAHFGDVSASGGYYVGSACDMIFSHAGTLTGSIGVIMNGGNMEGLMKKIGYKSEIIKSGKYKDIGSPMRDMTVEERKLLQDMIDDSYDQFITAVAEGRKLPIDKVKELADGRIYTGRQAMQVGLVDKLGDFQDAIDAAAQRVGMEKNPKVIYSTDSFENVFSLLNSKLGGNNILSEALDITPRLEYRLYMK